jgi:multidrug transporter EmrE-like cation transporter
MISPALGMLFGLINTASIHVAKSMQRHGINTLRWRALPEGDRSRKHAVIYIIGVVVNNVSAIWLILANRFSAPAYATGMFGIGLVLMLLYSSIVLGERVHWLNYIGALLVIVGTAAFSVHALQAAPITSVLDPRRVGLFCLFYFVPAGVLVFLGVRSGRKHLMGFSFGLLTGSLASIDPVLKSIGQTAGGVAGFVPSVGWGWIPFLLSFPLALGAFAFSQYAFYRGATASDTVSAHTSFYVLVPVVVQIIALPGYRVTPVLAAGIATIVVGIGLLQRRRTAVDVAQDPDQEVST